MTLFRLEVAQLERSDRECAEIYPIKWVPVLLESY